MAPKKAPPPPVNPDPEKPKPDPDNPTPENPKEFLIKWIDTDGSVLQAGNVKEGAMPAYNGPMPTLPESVDFATGRPALYISGAPTKARLYNHTLGWNPAPVNVTGAANYTAKFAKGEKLEFPENYYAEEAAIYKVMDSIPYKMYLNGDRYPQLVHALQRRIQIKAKMGYGPGYTPGEVTAWRNHVFGMGMHMTEDSLIGRTWSGPEDQGYSSINLHGEVVHVDGQSIEIDGMYVPANYYDYHPDDIHEDDCYGYQAIPFKATTPVIDGKVLNIVDSKIPNHMDRDDETQIVHSRRVSIDTNNDGAEDECMTLSPLYITHREMFNQIRPGDDISFRIHQYADRIGVSTTYWAGSGDILDGRVFPEDVESYGDYINDRDFLYKWATGNPDANGDNFQTIELVNPQIFDEEYPGGILVGDPYTGKASSLKSAD
ncbi:MAG: hypothetical protein LBK73_01100 [Treponema sp.]|nr:hypothetical protein [Treponema sp.]